jgi:hypothetical protein
MEEVNLVMMLGWTITTALMRQATFEIPHGRRENIKVLYIKLN